MSLSVFVFTLEVLTEAFLFVFACLTIAVWLARRFGDSKRRPPRWLAVPVIAYGMFLLEMEKLAQPHRYDHVLTVKKKRKKSSAKAGGKKKPGCTEHRACDRMTGS